MLIRHPQEFTQHHFYTQRKSGAGFSLIEILIVVAVLGILASLILTAVSASRIKAYNNRIRTSVGQIRWLAEEVYDTQGASYENWTHDPTIQQQLTILLDDIDKNYGDSAGAPYVTVLRESQNKEYCVSAPLRQQANAYYCIDATAVFRVTHSPCPDYPVDGAPLRCPAN
jgi:prepilin-type N-terminal cleavage/methylation domain-containing protein